MLTGGAVLVTLATAALVGSVAGPAQALPVPIPGSEEYINFYSDTAKKVLVGQYWYGNCFATSGEWGTRTAIMSNYSAPCGPVESVAGR